MYFAVRTVSHKFKVASDHCWAQVNMNLFNSKAASQYLAHLESGAQRQWDETLARLRSASVT